MLWENGIVFLIVERTGSQLLKQNAYSLTVVTQAAEL
jgi:hypothetical protein